MNYGLVIGLLIVGTFAVLVGAVVVFSLRWMMNGAGAGSSIDAFLQSGKANPNPPHIPPTYHPEVKALEGGARYSASVQRLVLDDPETQMRKYRESRTTTQAELSNIT